MICLHKYRELPPKFVESDEDFYPDMYYVEEICIKCGKTRIVREWAA